MGTIDSMAYEDLSGVVSRTVNPYDALLLECSNDPVGPMSSPGAPQNLMPSPRLRYSGSMNFIERSEMLYIKPNSWTQISQLLTLTQSCISSSTITSTRPSRIHGIA